MHKSSTGIFSNNNNTSIHANQSNLVHRTFELVPIVDKLPLQIESLACYDNIIIIGTNCGRILINEVKINETMANKFESSFEKSIAATKKPIQQLEAIRLFDILIALFDSQLHVFDLDKYQLQYSITKTKGCSLFATSISSDQKLLRLCVACKKKLQFYYINILSKATSQFMELVSDLELAEIPRNLKFTKDNLIVFSLRKDYYYYELPSTSAAISSSGVIKQPETRFSTGARQIEPLCEKLHNEFFTLAVDENKTIIYDTKGKPYLEYPILWSSSPSAVCSVGPYLAGILPLTNSVELVTIQPTSISVQVIDFIRDSNSSSSTNTNTTSSSLSSSFLTSAVAPVLAVTNTVSSITGSLTSNANLPNINPADRIKILKSNGHSVCYIATQSFIWCLIPIKINDQLEQVIRYKNFELGLNLIASLSYFNQINECPFSKTWPLNSSTKAPIGSPKWNVLTPFLSINSMINEIDENLHRRIKNLNALDLFCKKKFSESFKLFQEMKTDPSHLIAFVPGLLPDDYRKKLKFDDYYPMLDSKELEDAIDCLIDFLQYKRNEFLKEAKPMDDASNFSLIPLIDGRPVLKTRSQILQIIDTTLLKCYLKTKDNLVPFFLRREPNFLHLGESERLLVQHNKISELIILYEKKASSDPTLHEKALNLLTTESTKASSPLFSLKHLVEYLKKLGNENIELVFKYAKNVIETDAKIGMKVFMGDLVKIDEKLAERARLKSMNLIKKRKSQSNIKSVIGNNGYNNNGSSILSFLLKINTNNTNNSKNNYDENLGETSHHHHHDNKFEKNSSKKTENLNDLEILEDDEDDEQSKVLNRELVFKFLSESIEPSELSANLIRLYLQYCIFVWNDKNSNLNNELIDSYIKFIENGDSPANKIQLDLASKQISEQLKSTSTYKQMLIYFLSETNIYEPTYALSKLNLEKYAEERAIVLGKLGKHHEALSIYVNILNDTDKAEAYCDSVYMKSNIIDSKQVYYQLLQIYLNSEYEEIRIGASIRLLNAHSNEIGSVRSLELLPAELMKCKNLTPFFENMLTRLVRNKHNTQIINRLMFALELQIHETKILCQDKKFIINDEQICKECNKRIGKSAMVRFPNGDLIHYGCSKNSEAFSKRLNQ